MTPEEQALATVVALLNDLGIPFMLTGSIAAGYHGRPRTTQDTDLVIDPTAAQLDGFVAGLSAAGFYVDSDGARRALAARSLFNAISTRDNSKLDFIIRRDRPFSRVEFDRRAMVDLGVVGAVPAVTPEDAILSKLDWARRGGDSERQLTDAQGVLDLNARLDRAYIERWAAELGVLDLWRRISGTDPT